MNFSYNFFKDDISRYSVDCLEDCFNNLDEEQSLCILHQINKDLNLINQFPNSNKKIINFRKYLKNLLLSKGIQNDFFYNIEIIEELYNSVLKDKEKLKLKDIELIKSLLNFAKNKQDIISSELKKIADKDSIFNDISLQSSNYDREIEALSKLINYNLQSLSYTNKNLINENNELVLPNTILTDQADIIDDLELANHLKNTGMWDIVQDLDYNFRFFSVPFSSIVDENKEILSLDMNYFRYALISTQRMNFINSTTSCEYYIQYRKILTNYQIEMMVLKEIFYRFYFIDISEDNNQYKGLTIEEWIIGFLSLKEISTEYGFKSVNIDIVKNCFLKNGINSDKKADLFINYLTYKQGKGVDLYDNPLIRMDNEDLLIFPITIKNCNIERVLSSIFSKFDLHILDKGKNFEKEVFKYLKEMEKDLPIKVHETKFNVKINVKKVQYQFDAIIEWDDYIFIIECKNRSIANTTYISLNQFDQKILEYIKQVDRLEDGLSKNPEKHVINLSNKKIIKIVLNSLPFSLDYPISNIYFTDYSCFLKFFSSKELLLENISQGNQRDSQVVQTLWSGIKPTPKEFIKYLESPPQVTYIKSKINSYMTTHQIGNYFVKLERSCF